MTELDVFTRAYVTALFWTTDENEFPEYCYSGEFGISNDDIGRLAPETLARVIEDCNVFRLGRDEWLAQAGDEDQNGHDFALTRNGHGTGYWDRGYSDTVSKVLTNASKSFGEFSLYKGDDGLIYGM